MKCYCYEESSKFIWCVEDAPDEYFQNIINVGFEKRGDKYFREYPIDNFHWTEDKKIIAENFARLGESYFLHKGDWKTSMTTFIEKCEAHNIRWYTTGSMSETLIGVNIQPGDIDIISHTDDFFKMREIFSAYTIEPFVDYHGTWFIRYFARLCINDFKVEIAADNSRNEENHFYESIKWETYDLKVEPLKDRYEIELYRGRKDRIKAIEEYLNQYNI